MSFGHLAAAVFVCTLQALAAQQAPLRHISFLVLDGSAARIPSAAVEIVSSVGLVNEIRAGKTGEALIDLSCGIYDATVTSVGFERKTETVNVTDQAGQVLAVKLAIDPNFKAYPGPVVGQLSIPEEHAAPLVQLPSAQVPLRVIVKDQSGAFIPQVRIEVRSSESGTAAEIKTDVQAEAVLHLDPGSYSVSILSRGFDSWSGKVNLQQNGSQAIFAELKVGGGGGIQVMPFDSGIETVRQILVVLISLEPLESLVDLPSHKLRWRAHF